MFHRLPVSLHVAPQTSASLPRHPYVPVLTTDSVAVLRCCRQALLAWRHSSLAAPARPGRRFLAGRSCLPRSRQLLSPTRSTELSGAPHRPQICPEVQQQQQHQTLPPRRSGACSCGRKPCVMSSRHGTPQRRLQVGVHVPALPPQPAVSFMNRGEFAAIAPLLAGSVWTTKVEHICTAGRNLRSTTHV